MLLTTYKCNLRCSYCYEPKIANFSLTVPKAKSIIEEQLSSIGDSYDSVEIQFMGGEPLLQFPLIQEVSEWLWTKPLNKHLMVLFAPTNGTLLTYEMKKWFYKNRNRFNLGLSFDGNTDMQNANRSESFKYVDLEFFSNTWPEQNVKMTISPDTVDKLSSGVIFLHNRGFKFISADLAMGDNVMWTKSHLITFKTELNKLSDFYMSNPNLIPFSMLRLNVARLGVVHKKTLKTCSCGEDMICVDWNGKTYACHLFSPIALSIEKATASNILYNFANHDQFISQECRSCALCGLCNRCCGMNYICNGDVAKPSAFHCSAFKILFVANCRFTMRKASNAQDWQLLRQIQNIINAIA